MPDTPSPADDARWMREAIAEARLGEGGTRPNPPVGAVLVSPDGRLLARGRHVRAGGPHAEVACLAAAEAAAPGCARGATLYVSLEPCSTAGRVGPCTGAILAAGVARVVAAATDENPRHAGRGFAALRAAGVQVAEGVCADEARPLLEPFFKHVRTGLPWVQLKIAQSLDGAIADHAGASQWITGPAARTEVDAMRRRADVVFVGAGTALADDPSLRRRGVPPDFAGLPGRRCVLDARGRVPETAKIFADGHADETIVATSPLCPAARRRAWEAAGAEVWEIPLLFPPGSQGDRPPALDLRALLTRFGEAGFLRALCEGGASLASSLLAEGLVDELSLFVAPMVLGGGALRAFGGVPFDLPTAPRFRLASATRTGEDLLLDLRPAPAAG